MADVLSTIKSIDSASFASEEERKQALIEAHALVTRLETPVDAVIRLTHMIPGEIACVKTAIDMKLFDKWVNQLDSRPSTADELAALVVPKGQDDALFRRILRHLAATHVIWADTTKGGSTYTLSPFAKGIVKEQMSVGIEHGFFFCYPAALNLPAFLKSIDYKTPTGKDGEDNFTRWNGGKQLWEYLAANQDAADNLNDYMKISSGVRGRLNEVYQFPTADGGKELSCEKKDDVLFVDIGGSLGHDVQNFKNTFPNAEGRLVVQDQASVIEEAKLNSLDSKIELMAHDFFTPQPVKGAKFYTLRAILHDWPDSDALRILENLRPAMKKGYSKLLLHECVVPEFVPDYEATSRDMTMLFVASGKERTENQWSTLLSSAGYKIVKVWKNPLYGEGVIETEIA